MSDHKIRKGIQSGRNIFTFLVLTFCTFQALQAQQASPPSGMLSGIITDQSTGEVLPFANVNIVRTNIGITSQADGSYRLNGIPLGQLVVVFSFVSYKSDSIVVTLKKGESKVLNIQLEEDKISLKEVIVSAQITGQRQAITQQVNSDAIVNIVSGDKLNELPDLNAAEAIGRISGISVERNGGEASKIFLRGLSPTLTSVTVNGVRLPSSDFNDRSVDLSTISPELLSDISVFKSPTADMDGDALGGIISLGLSPAPKGKVIQIRGIGGYNALSEKFGNYRSTIVWSNRLLDDKLGFSLKGNYEKTNRSSEDFNTNWNVISDDLTAEGTRRFEVNRLTLDFQDRYIRRYGTTAQVDYKYKTGTVIAQFFYSEKKTSLRSQNNILYGGGSAMIHKPSHSKTKNGTYQFMLSGIQDLGGIEASWVMAKNKTTHDNYYHVTMEIEQLSAVNKDIDPVTGEPLQPPRSALELFGRQTYNYDDAYLKKYFWEPEKVTHDNMTISLDMKKEFSNDEHWKGYAKMGVKFRSDQRKRGHEHQLQNWYGSRAEVRDQAENLAPYSLLKTDHDQISIKNFARLGNHISDQSQYFIYPSYSFDVIEDWHQYQHSTLADNLGDEALKYGVTEKVSATYLLLKLQYQSWFTLLPGLRYEYADNTYTGRVSSLDDNGNFGSANDTTAIVKYGEWLPNVHLKLTPKNWFDIRLSVTKTLARPDYNMITPRAKIDLSNGKISRGNPELKHTESWNFDAVASFYPEHIALISIGGFLKKFNNYFNATNGGAIGPEEAERLGYPRGLYDLNEQYINFDESKVYGLELDVQSNLAQLSGWKRGIVLGFNSTLLRSETYYPRYQRITVYDPDLRRNVVDIENSYYTLDKCKLPNQVNMQSNLTIGYEFGGFSMRVSSIWQLKYLNEIVDSEKEGAKFGEKYRKAYFRLDASISQRIGEHFKVMANWANMTSAKEEAYQYQSRFVTLESRYGTTADLGLQYKF